VQTRRASQFTGLMDLQTKIQRRIIEMELKSPYYEADNGVWEIPLKRDVQKLYSKKGHSL
jgi:hypothetical protein